MAGTVSKSIVLDFEQGGDASGNNGGELVLIYDDRAQDKGGLNVRTQPLFTDKAYFLLYPYKALNIAVTTSAGTARLNPTNTVETRSETVTFNETNEAVVRRPVSLIKSVKWLGKNGGTVTPEGSKLKIAEAGNFVAVVEYETIFNVITLTPPTLDPDAFDEYTVNLVVTADEGL
ncbi:VHS1066 protein [Vibrio phage 1]|nr:VHS1066 protein [Vibrio phage 1]